MIDSNKVKITGAETPVSSEALAQVEIRLDIHLPDQYRQFLLKHNGGKPTPDLFECADGGGSFIHKFLAIHEGPYDNFEQKSLSFWADKAMPDNILPIACDAFGNYVCLSVSGADTGSVYFWNHEERPRKASYKNLCLIAESFDQFLASLSEKPVVPFAAEINQIFQHGNIAVLHQIIAAGWDVNSGPYRPDITALDFAAMYNKKDIARVLLEHGARVGRAIEIVKRCEAPPALRHDYTEMKALLEAAAISKAE